MQDELPLVSPQTIGFCDSPWKDKARMWAELLCELLGGAYPLPKRLHGIGRDSLSFPIWCCFWPSIQPIHLKEAPMLWAMVLHCYIFHLKWFFTKLILIVIFLSPTPPRASLYPYPPNIIFIFSPLSLLSVCLSPHLLSFRSPSLSLKTLKKITWNTNENHNKHTKRKKTNKQ